MSDAENKYQSEEAEGQRTPWGHIIRGMWRSPLGLLGVSITTVSITLMVVGLVIDMLGLVENPYAAIATYLVLPGGMITGLLLIPVAAYLRRREFHKHGISREHLKINLSDHKHRRFVIALIVLTVVNFAILAIVGYEGYHFTESPYFCGVVCHDVMAPEYTAYQRSPHSKVKCVECHIGPGAEWFVQAKISGLRQVAAVMTGTFSRPIPAPVSHLRPARDTCEQCHWPEKFHGKKVKSFTHFTNEDQVNPEVVEIALHIGGRNRHSGAFEGIHWHVSKDVEVRYLAADDKRTQIARVKVKRPDGSEEEFVKSDIEVPAEREGMWRTMDCIDCHNRPTHVYDMPEDRVDFGLLSDKINPAIPGIREDSLAVLTKEYASRDEAEAMMADELRALQTQRSEEQVVKYGEDINKAAAYLLEAYLGNIWPKMNVTWGTYKGHLGHQDADDGYGCWRCHDEEHQSESGKTITQDCSLCHDEPK
ncbi:MAG: NapC/NirT family cytochrome c [Desulfobulbaceae bacterium]|nr:NapC/NirT family cytochrome c [Desulfobulbaceae bacterium]HIJ78497.1 cytochrome C [Deltaproteobacteria bacterium]